MSHVETIELQVKDLEALKAACKENGWTFLEGQKTFKWYGRWVNDFHGETAAYKHGIKPEDYGKCDHAISVPGASYEIGLVKKGSAYQVVFDAWGGGGLPKKIGSGAEKLKQSYALAVVQKQCKRKGHRIREHRINKDGSIFLKVAW